VDDRLLRLRAGQTLLTPKGVPHTYCVTSETARFLVMTTNGDFEAFVRAASRPAVTATLPPVGAPPGPEQQARLAELGREHGIDLIDAPLALEDAVAAPQGTSTTTTPSSRTRTAYVSTGR
jgi:hypothetical protein